LVLALLAATAVAFAITEGAKLQPSPLRSTRVTKVFSPDAKVTRIDGRRYGVKVAVVHFKLRSSETVEAWIEDKHGNRVRTLLNSTSYGKGHVFNLVWDGFTDDGIAAPDGVYRPLVKLDRSHRTFGLPNRIVLDTVAPRITMPKVPHAIVSPDGDGHKDAFSARYRVSEPAHGILYVQRAGSSAKRRVEYTLFQRLTGTLTWNGKVDGVGAKPGNYVLWAAAQDTAGNLAKPTAFAVVQVRYVVLARSRVVVKPGAKFALRVSTDAPKVHWSLHGRSGDLPRGTLHLTAPRSHGVFHLYVTAAGHAARCTVVVA
jgi:hypothetical protein